ncbi:MAG: hypothetical protein WDM87_04875 [Terracidiphilus sp.]
MTQTLPFPLLQLHSCRRKSRQPSASEITRQISSTIHSMSPVGRSPKLSSAALLSFGEAFAVVAACAAKLARTRPTIERVRLNQALGRVLAEPLRADSDQPPFPRSTRDGFACRAAEASTHRALSVAGSTRAGQTPSGPLPRGAVWEIMTGAPVPAGADGRHHARACGRF